MLLRSRPALGALSALVLSHLFAGFGTGTAHAQEAPATPSADAPNVDTAEGLAIDVEPGAAGLDADELRAAIARETGVRIASAVTPQTTRLLVSQDGPSKLRFQLVEPGGRRVVERSVDLSTVKQSSALDTAAFVAANLLQDEASSLLASLRARDAAPPKPKEPPRPELSPCAPRTPNIVTPIGADVAPYVGTSSFEKAGTVRHVSLEFVGGHHAGVRGLQFAPLLSWGGETVCGVQFGGLGVHTSGSVTGVGFAGLLGYHGGSLLGVSFAGLGGWIEGPTTGVAAAGLGVRTEDVTGLASAGFMTVSRHVEGAQITGAINWADSITGVQAAGLGAFTARQMKGVQLAALSFASEVSGAQLGVLNIGGYVKGVQLGVVNFARTSDASIGVLSFVTEGRTHLDAWAASDATASVAVQHGSRLVHNYYGGTVSFAGDAGVAVGPLLGIGVHLPAAPLFVDIDVIAHVLFDPQDSSSEPQSLNQARVTVGLQIAPGFAAYVGPTFNALMTKPGQATRVNTLPALGWTAESADQVTYFWPGIVAGVRGF
jgi:hypothetical protein